MRSRSFAPCLGHMGTVPVLPYYCVFHLCHGYGSFRHLAVTTCNRPLDTSRETHLSWCLLRHVGLISDSVNSLCFLAAVLQSVIGTGSRHRCSLLWLRRSSRLARPVCFIRSRYACFSYSFQNCHPFRQFKGTDLSVRFYFLHQRVNRFCHHCIQFFR